MNDYDDYMDRIRDSANARRPMTLEEWQCIGAYVGLVAITLLIALWTKH